MQQVVRQVSDVALTEHVVATRSAQGLPLAAVASLLPADTPSAVPAEPLDLLRAVRRSLEQRAANRPLVVAVDDAHLLDPLSATLLHHLAGSANIRLLIATRSGEPVADAITALWRDGLAQRVDVQPLARDDVAVLLRAVLGGEVEVATARRLWSVTGGNPLYLHEIVIEAQRTGALATVHGVWRWRGKVRVGARLRELVELRLAALDDEERDVVALLGVGDALPQALVEEACAPRGAGLTRTARVRRRRAEGRALARRLGPSAVRRGRAHGNARE